MELKNEFKPITKQDWEAKLSAELKNISLDKIKWQINEESQINPIYFKEDHSPLSPPFVSAIGNDWSISQNYTAKLLIKSNKSLLEDLMGGLEAPYISLKTIPNQKEWKSIFKDVQLNYIKLHFDLSKEMNVNRFIKSFHKYLAGRKYNLKKIQGTLSSSNIKQFYKSIDQSLELLPKFKMFAIELGSKRSKKSDVIKDLSNALIQLEECIFNAKKNKISVSKIRKLVHFKMHITSDFFTSIAEIRALKILCQNLFEAYKLKTTFNYPIHAFTSKIGYGEDQHTNMIRSTVQAIAAINGGVQFLSIAPTNKSRPNKFTNRIARNLQHILKMESQMHLVQDPVAGSYFVDKLSDELIEKSWMAFVKHYE